jgi:UPF0755 protein
MLLKKYIITILLAIGLVLAWVLFKMFGPAVPVEAPAYFYISKGTTYTQLLSEIEKQQILHSNTWFKWVSNWMEIKHIRPGRYKIKKGMSVFKLLRMIRNGQQSYVKLSIIKERTLQDLAGKIGTRLDMETDSATFLHFITNHDSLFSYGVDSSTVLALVMPYSYELSWADEPRKIVDQFHKSWQLYWTAEKKKKAAALGLSPLEVSTLASIVEEESNDNEDRYNIASTYLNRLRKGMKLQADPTVKYVTRNFKLNRIMYGHLDLSSPYNTYQNTGLPPGPICTPSLEALDAVLNAPATDYLFFVASWKFDGSTIFTSNYTDHRRYVNLFHEEQKRRAAAKAQFTN